MTCRRLVIGCAAVAAVLASDAHGFVLRAFQSEETRASIRFAVIGDFGTGGVGQRDLARVMAETYEQQPYDVVLTVGDNIYGGWSPRAARERFELPYKPLLDAGVEFFASLGNHDSPRELDYPLFNMGGRRYYQMSRGGADFFALDSNYLDPEQVRWLATALAASSARWKIAYFHHPLYSSGERHGSAADLRITLAPLFRRYGVQVVFSGHDHVYERIVPQDGITYFVVGSSGQLRPGDLDTRSRLTASGFDRSQTFLRVDLDDESLSFRAIDRSGAAVDAGKISR